MTSRKEFDLARSQAIRRLLMEKVAEESQRRRAPLKRVAFVVTLTVAAAALATGGTALALNGPDFFAGPTPTPTSETVPPSGTPTPSAVPEVTSQPTVPDATAIQAQARAEALEACTVMHSALDEDGNVKSDAIWLSALREAGEALNRATASDPHWQSMSAHIEGLAAIPIPGPDSSSQEKLIYREAFLLVADDCFELGSPFSTD